MKLTKSQSIAIKTKLLKADTTQQDIANLWGTSKQNVNNMLSGRNYVSESRFLELLEIANTTEKELNILIECIDR